MYDKIHHATNFTNKKHYTKIQQQLIAAEATKIVHIKMTKTKVFV